jgi:hypothetical protein
MQIFKYPFPVVDGILQTAGVLDVPFGAMFISAGLDLQNDLCVWAVVDAAEERRRDVPYMLAWTGETPPMWPFLGTFKYADASEIPFIYHVFLKQVRAE